MAARVGMSSSAGEVGERRGGQRRAGRCGWTPDQPRGRGLLRPHEHLRAAAIGLVEHQTRAATFEVFQGQVHAIGIEVDAVVVEERDLLASAPGAAARTESRRARAFRACVS